MPACYTNQLIAIKNGKARLETGEEFIFHYEKYPYQSLWELTIINQPTWTSSMGLTQPQ